ncbi:MAG: hypothetical protein ISS70_17715 [Phycisphaerae bacterium]|nr:hypothetical protein [Phycisphaerae bacterium]
MKKTQGLKTLRDYRRAAKKLLFSPMFGPASESTSPYDAIKTALGCTRNLISFSRTHTLLTDPWDPIYFGNTEYRMKNLQLFHAVQLMEFANTYKEKRPINDLYTGWPQRPDASVFEFAGLSYLEASFDFVRRLGHDVAGKLGGAYLRFKKLKGGVDEVFSVLSNTHQTDGLQICPEPDEIIRTWFDEIVKLMQYRFSQDELSDFAVKKQFNSTFKQLEYERNAWKKATGDDSDDNSNDIKYTRALNQSEWAEVFGVSRRTIRHWIFRDQKINKYHFDPVSCRLWRLPRSEAPSNPLVDYHENP